MVLDMDLKFLTLCLCSELAASWQSSLATKSIYKCMWESFLFYLNLNKLYELLLEWEGIPGVGVGGKHFE